MAGKLQCPTSLTLLVLFVATAGMYVLPLCSGVSTVPPTPSPTAAATTDNLTVPAAEAVVPVGSSTTIPASAEATTPAKATASKKFPLAPPDVLEPAAEVVTALPVPVPETLPSAEGLGFGPNGFGTNGGLGGGGCCGGFGNNGFLGNEYNGFFNSAPARRSRLGNVLAPLLVAGAAAAAMF